MYWAKLCETNMLNEFSGFRKEYTVGLLLFLPITIIWIWGFNTNYFFAKRDAFDYAQVGREIANCNGFSTLQIFPRHIPLLREKGHLDKENWPNLHRYPLVPILNAFFYKFTKGIIKAAVLQSGIVFLLSIPILFILAAKLTNLNVAIVSTIFYVQDTIIFESSYNGMTESLAVLLVLTLFLIGFSGELLRWKCFAMGVICGLSYLTRTQLTFLLPLAVFYAWINVPPKTRFVSIILLLLGFLAAAGPWFIRNIALVGDPTFSFFTSRQLVLYTSPVYSDLEVQLEAPVEILQVLKVHGIDIADKFLRNISKITSLRFWYTAFPSAGVFLIFLFGSFIYRRRSTDKKYDFFRGSLIVLIFCNILIVNLVCHWGRFYAALSPLLYIVGVNEILTFFGSSNFKYSERLKHVVFYGMILFGTFNLCEIAMVHKKSPAPVTMDERRSYEFLKRITTKDTVIASDVSWKIPLHVGCRSLRLPIFPSELLKINDSYLPIDYVLITKDVLDSAPLGRPRDFTKGNVPRHKYAPYSQFFKSDDFLERFQFVEELTDGSVLFGRLQ